MALDEGVWSFFQEHLGYNDEEMKQLRANPRNEEILSKAPDLMNKTIVAEVEESHGCNSQHRVGDKLYFDGAGNLITKLNPKRICIYALSTVAPLIFTTIELFYAGADPNEIRFNRSGCFDVGVRCDGWGRIVLEVRLEDRK